MLRSRLALPLAAVAMIVAAGSALAAPIATLVHDVNPHPPGRGDGLQPQFLTAIGPRALFRGREPGTGYKPWGTDGTTHGTMLLRDTCMEGQPLGVLAGVAFFRGGCSVSSLWRSDGTPLGTFDLGAPLGLSDVASTVFGDAFLFTSCAGELCTLSTSDGTVGGTHVVKELGERHFGGVPRDLVVMGGAAYFVAPTPQEQPGLWRTDGTAAGTVVIENDLWEAGGPTALDSRLVFIARGDAGIELWGSDGTVAGTGPLTEFEAHSPFRSAFKAIGDAVYFIADDVTHGHEIWRSDGTAAGTWRVTDFGYAFAVAGPGRLGELAKVGSRLVFIADDGIEGRRLFVSDGSPSSEVPLEGCPGGCPDFDASGLTVSNLIPLGGALYLRGHDAAHGTELWRTDGTAANTRRVADLCSGTCEYDLASLTAAAGALYFSSTTSEQHTGLWRSDGTAAGTALVVPGVYVERGPHDSDTPIDHAVLGAQIVFPGHAQQGHEGTQLWISPGETGSGGPVTLVGDDGGGSSAPGRAIAVAGRPAFSAFDGERLRNFRIGTDGTLQAAPHAGLGFYDGGYLEAALGGVAFWVQEDGSGQYQVWRTDWTPAGTFQLTDFAYSMKLGPLQTYQGQLVFTANRGSQTGGEPHGAIWRTDGSVAGTHELFTPPLEFQSIQHLTVLGDEVFFLAATDDPYPHQHWRSDGTTGGTRQLTTVDPEPGFPQSPEFTRAGAFVYFTRTRTDFALWRTDGTAEGTVPGPPTNTAFSLHALGGALLYYAPVEQFSVARGLWRTEGGSTAASLLATLSPNVSEDLRRPLRAQLGSRLLFGASGDADGDADGVELWITDGTSQGTQLVKDILPGPLSSSPLDFVAAPGAVFFSADDGGHGNELWRSDGTTAGTRLVHDIAPGGRGAEPRLPSVIGDDLYFAANDGLVGEEMWVLPLDPAAPSCAPSATALCLRGGRFRVEARWEDFAGNTGVGHAVALTADTGYFWFFNPANVEAIVKVLDGLGVNGHHWAFYGALSNVEYHLTVTDTSTGATRRYANPSGRFASVGDTQAFGPLGATGSDLALDPEERGAAVRRSASSVAVAPCVPSTSRLCLNGGRFAVEVEWSVPHLGDGVGTAVPLTSDTGYFWFFGPTNVELVLKVLDGRPVNGKFWVFYGALSNVDYTITVTDSETGQQRTYRNPQGRMASVGDTEAF